MDTKKLLEILDKHVNQEALLKEIAVEMMIPALKEFVASTENKYDDMLIDAFVKFIESK